MKQELKLFVWTRFNWDHQDGLAVAIAETEEEAKELILKDIDLNYEVTDWGVLEVRDLSKCAYSVSG